MINLLYTSILNNFSWEGQQQYDNKAIKKISLSKIKLIKLISINFIKKQYKKTSNVLLQVKQNSCLSWYNKENAEKIKEEGFHASSKGRMGPGVYFTNDYDTAYKIGSHRAKHQGKQPQVIKSYVDSEYLKTGLHPKWNKVTEGPFYEMVCKQTSVITNSSEYEIYVKGLTGITYNFEVKLNMYIQQVAQMYADKVGVDLSSVKLIFAGKQLDEYNTLNHYNISYGSTVHAVLRLR